MDILQYVSDWLELAVGCPHPPLKESDEYIPNWEVCRYWAHRLVAIEPSDVPVLNNTDYQYRMKITTTTIDEVMASLNIVTHMIRSGKDDMAGRAVVKGEVDISIVEMIGNSTKYRSDVKNLPAILGKRLNALVEVLDACEGEVRDAFLPYVLIRYAHVIDDALQVAECLLQRK